MVRVGQSAGTETKEEEIPSTRGTQVRCATETDRKGRGSEFIEEITKTVVGVGHRRGHVGPDSLRGVCLIERVEDPAVLSQKHRARRCHRNEPK